LLVVLSLSSPLMAQMSHEETVVRNTYAKLSFAAQLGSVQNAFNHAHGAPSTRSFALDTQDGLQFEVKSCSVGNVADILKQSYDSLVTKPMGGDALTVTNGTFTYTRQAEQTSQQYVKAKWEKAQDLSNQDWNVPFSQVLATMDDKDYSRYAACTITASFEKRSIDYKSLFLFRKDNAGQKVLAVDLVAGNASVTHYVDHSAYPTAFLNTEMRDNPTIDKWLHEKQIKGCNVGTKELCCDPATGVCGIAAGDADAKPDTKPEVKPVTQLPNFNRRPNPPPLLLTSLPLPKVKNAYMPLCEDMSYTIGPFVFGYQDFFVPHHRQSYFCGVQ
jgi:hypothetical protein